MIPKRLIVLFLGLLTVTCHAEQCARRIKTGKSASGSLTVPLQNVGLTCMDVTPPTAKDKYVLLKLPSSLSVSIDGETYDSATSPHRHCFVMTPFQQCPLWYENIKKTCPGGTTAQPIFGRTTIYIKADVDSTLEGINETTISYELIHRFDGFFNDECIDLQPPTVGPTTVSALPDTTAPVTPSMSSEDTQHELTTEETVIQETSTNPTASTTQRSKDLQPPIVGTPSMSSEDTQHELTTEETVIRETSTNPTASTTQRSKGGTGGRNPMDHEIPLIVISVVIFALVIVLILKWSIEKMNNRRKAAKFNDVPDEQRHLTDSNGNSNNSNPKGAAVIYRREADGQ